LAFGPKRLNGKLADVRSMLHRCERVFLEVSQKLHNNKREYRIKSTTLKLAKDNLFANDPETRAGRSVGDREAIASGKLKDDAHQVHLLDVSVQDMEAILVVIKAKRSDLRDTQGRLKDQIRLCQEEIGLGDHWGSKVSNAGELKTNLSVVSNSELDDLIGKVDGEIHLQEMVEVEPAKSEERITAPDPIFIKPAISIADAMSFKGDLIVEEKEGKSLVDYQAVATAIDGVVVPSTPMPTATVQEVDAFFADASVEEIKIPKQNLIDDATINSILDSFESSK
jgi:hypothetical protein